MRTVTTMRTICEVLREICWHSKDPVIKEKCMEATVMAKKMDEKLREYSGIWDEGMWEPVEDADERRVNRKK